MAVITTFKFDDEVAAGETPRQPNRTHGRFRARTAHPHPFHRGNELPNFARHDRFNFGWGAKAQAIDHRLLHGANHGGMGMTGNHRPPGTDIIGVAAVVFVI